LILKTTNMRESNKLIILYTQKFGLIYTTIQSVRELRSKMRFHTNRLSLVEVDVVRGRDIWRIVGIHEYISIFDVTGTVWYSLMERMANLILRLCSGEETHNELWEDIVGLYDYINSHKEDSNNTKEFVEIIFVSRMLYHLGYSAGEMSFIHIQNPYTTEVFSQIKLSKKELIVAINNGIQTSQL
jgi:recombinational DNA repair protein (RecF pathway)